MRILSGLIALIILVVPINGFSENALQLIGKGEVKYLRFIKVYEAELYVADSQNKVDILSPDVTKCLQLTYAVSLVPENFVEGAETILQRQHSPSYLDTFSAQIKRLHNAYQPVEEGDQYQLCYSAEDTTTRLILNNKELAAIDSPEFSSLYFGIWLYENSPIDSTLRKNLLGQNI